MYTSLVIVLLTVFATFLVIYSVDSLLTSLKRRKSTKKLDRVMKGMDYRFGHR